MENETESSFLKVINENSEAELHVNLINLRPDENYENQNLTNFEYFESETTVEEDPIPEATNCDIGETRQLRGIWKHPLDFLFSCISVMVGLGNVWRFPYLCYKNGGGVFLIIYITTMIFCGLPIVLQEVVIGQYLGEGGSIIIGKVCPILKGVGMSTMVMVTYYNIYYCVIISWSMYYFIASFTTIPDVPWNTCKGWWNSPNCWLAKKTENGSTSTNVSNEKVASVIEFWKNRVLQSNQGIEFGLGNIQWELAGTLFLGWLIVYLIVCRGLHQSGYIVWFTALSPYLIMFVLLIRALTLEGCMEGIRAYLNIDWKYFGQGRTWLDASTQVFFDYSVGNGALAALGSYNKFNHNCLRDATIACLVCTCTCLTAGLLVFATLGNMAYLQGTTVDEVATSGPGLVFLSYPELVLNLPFSFLWSSLFFAMLLILGIDTAFCSVESLVTGIVDKWQEYLRSYRKLIATLVCLTCYILGIPMVFHGGVYLFQIVDFYAASGMPLLWICFFETIAISWCYGTKELSKNVEEMLGENTHFSYKLSLKFLCLCWSMFTPAIILGIFVYYICTYTPVTYGEKYHYPKWAEIIGLLISFSSMIWIPLYAIYYLILGVKTSQAVTLKDRFFKTLVSGISPRVNEENVLFSNIQEDKN